MKYYNRFTPPLGFYCCVTSITAKAKKKEKEKGKKGRRENGSGGYNFLSDMELM